MSDCHLNTCTCGCCEGISAETPVTIENRSGLSAIAYRVGTYGAFKESMLSAITSQAKLDALTTRADNDPSIAFVDAWSTVLDVLSFYQERIASEGFLRTATERRSILELARSIGYELRPGVAASTYLAFTVEETPGSPEEVTVAIGTKAQSIPGQDELPQTFETVEEIVARGVWNAMPARTTRPQTIVFQTEVIWLEGTANNVLAGDPLLFVGEERESWGGSERWDIRRAKLVEIDRDNDRTKITLDHPLGSVVPLVHPASEGLKVYALRGRAALFGHNAPDWNAMPKEIRERYAPDKTVGGAKVDTADDYSDWPLLTLAGISGNDQDVIYLDTTYPKFVVDSWVVLSTPTYQELYKVTAAIEDAKVGFTLSAKTSRLTLQGEGLRSIFNNKVRETVIFGQSEELLLAEEPIDTHVFGSSIELDPDAEPEGIVAGGFASVGGIEVGTEEARSEAVEIERVEITSDTVILHFTTDLLHIYERPSVRVNANVARATHGETKAEILGSGDGSASFQTFALKSPPLTYVSGNASSGAESTLEVRVNGILWDEADTLYGLSRKSRNYVVRHADDGSASITFGDGVQGARLPTGSENVTAIYRSGIGLAGLLRTGQISQLLTRPLGLKSVVNPQAPTGADDPESLDDARENAPLTVLTFERIVSLRDFEDYARAFAGIGKAQAVQIWDGERRIVHISIAAADGSEVAENSDLYKNLVDSIDGARHADHPAVVASFDGLTFDLSAKILVDSRYVAADVLAAVRGALLDAFSFDHRAFGESVTAAEVLAFAQRVEGVVAVDLDTLHFSHLTTSLQHRLVVRSARWVGKNLMPAQLLTVNPDGITLTEMTHGALG